MLKDIVAIILTIALLSYLPDADAKTDGDKFHLEALNSVLESELKDSGVLPPLRVEEVFLISNKSERVITPSEAKRLYGWQEFSLANLELNDSTNRFSAQMFVIEKDKSSRKRMEGITVKGKMVKLIEMPVLSKTVHAGDVITEDDIEWFAYPQKKVSSGMVTSKDFLVGKTPKRRILANSLVRTRDIEIPVLIEKGDTVNIVYEAEYLDLRTLGYALEDGKEGEFIRIQNPKSKRIVQARVKDKGTAYVLSSDSLNDLVASAGY